MTCRVYLYGFLHEANAYTIPMRIDMFPRPETRQFDTHSSDASLLLFPIQFGQTNDMIDNHPGKYIIHFIFAIVLEQLITIEAGTSASKRQ
jgi:hypothetical protein